MCTMMHNHCIMCTHGIPNMEKLQGVQKIAKWLPWMQILPLGWEKPSRGGQNDSKIIPPLRKRYRFRVDLHMCTMMQNHCIMCTHGIPNMEKLQGVQKIAKWLPWMQILPLGWEKPSRGGQNDSKIIPPLRKRYRFRVDLHMCTMMQNHCLMCTHGIPKMEKLQGVQKMEKWLPWTQILSLGWEKPSGGSK